jgi:hypothetical protein
MDFTERMERGRDAAAAKRHRGQTTGASAADWNRKRGEHEAGTWDHFVTVAKVTLQHAVGMAHEEYLRTVFPERYDDVTLDEVVAARIAAELDAIPF